MHGNVAKSAIEHSPNQELMLLESPVLDSVKPQGFLLIAVNGKGNDFWSVIQEDMILALHGSHASHLKHESLQN